MAGADCGVFLSRAEGWNLGLLEMMAMGKPVITTNYSGHTEFATPANALLVEVPEVEPAKDGVFSTDKATGPGSIDRKPPKPSATYKQFIN